MSTATIDRPVRSVSAIRADMADRLAARTEIRHQAWEMLSWAPKRLLAVARKIASITKLDVALSWLWRYGNVAVDVAGPKTSATILVTSKTGQRFIGWSFRTAFGIVGWTARTAYRIVTFPLRQVRPTRLVLEGIEARVDQVVGAVAPVLFGIPLSIGTAIAGWFDADHWYMAAVNVIAWAFAIIRLTRKFAPGGIWRVLLYVAEAPVLAAKAGPLLNRFGITRDIWSRVVDESDVIQMENEVVDEAVTATRKAAEDLAEQAETEHISLHREKLRMDQAGEAVPDELNAAIERASERALQLRERAEALVMAEEVPGTEPVVTTVPTTSANASQRPRIQTAKVAPPKGGNGKNKQRDRGRQR